MSKQRIYPPATIKKDFNLGIYRELKNLFYICNIDHFPSKTGDVYIVANLLGGYSVAELPYYEFIEVTQEIKDNIKLV